MLIHSLILSGFLIYCIFLSVPLFDRLEAIQGESTMQDVLLPAETDNIQHCLDQVIVGSQITEVHGWAFIDAHSSEGARIYTVLESDDVCYVFDTVAQLRSDVTEAYRDLGLDLDWSGFVCNLPSRKISDGQYVLGIYIRDGDIEAFQRTSYILVKSHGLMELRGHSG